ncbi:MAG: hypothetical protein HRF49_10025 [bacterium]
MFFCAVFLLDAAGIALFWFHGAPSDAGELYGRTPRMPDLSAFPYKYSAAWPYPPIVLEFSASQSRTGGGAGKSAPNYTWTRMNYLSQLDEPVYREDAPQLGVPPMTMAASLESLRPDRAAVMQGKAADDPALVGVLARRILKLDDGWIAEIDVPGKALNLYAPQVELNPAQVTFKEPLKKGQRPDLIKDLRGKLTGGEVPLAIAKGADCAIAVLGSRGTLLKFDRGGRYLDKSVVTAGDEAASEYWEPVGGVLLGKRLVGADTVLQVRRILALVLFAAPLCAYLAFAWARRP